MVGHQPSILRANRSGGGVGTSPGINPIVPYTTAALDYRSSWIAGEMMQKTTSSTNNPNVSAKLWGETLSNEDRAMRNSIERPAQRTVLPDPTRRTMYVESSGLERSLSTNIPDHPTAIQVNGLRQERTEHGSQLGPVTERTTHVLGPERRSLEPQIMQCRARTPVREPLGQCQAKI